MNELLVLVEFSEGVPEGWTPEVEDAKEGFIGGSLWTALEDGSGLGLLHFTDEASAEKHLRARIEGTGDGDFPTVGPSAVRHLRLQARHGMRLEGTHVGGYLTVLHRLAAPGFGGEESNMVAEAMESIEPLEGYAGHLSGVNVALPDEVWSVVFWSAPPVVPHPSVEDGLTIVHYRRVR